MKNMSAVVDTSNTKKEGRGRREGKGGREASERVCQYTICINIRVSKRVGKAFACIFFFQ